MGQTFKADAEGSQTSKSSFLQSPYKGPVKLVKLERKKVGSTEDCFVATVELQGENYEGTDVSGIEKEYIEWNPIEKDGDKIQNALNRLAYFVRHIAPEDKVLSIEVEVPDDGDLSMAWQQYVDKMIAVARQSDAFSRDDLEMKFVGDTYNKPKVTTPFYNNFIANKDSEEPLKWSPQEHRENKKYIAARDSAPDDDIVDQGAEDLPDLDDQAF